MSFLDYERRVGGFGPLLHPGDDIVEDMDVVRAFYADKKGKYPEDFGPVRLLEEKELDAAEASATPDPTRAPSPSAGSSWPER